MYKYIRKKRIKINGKRAEISTVLNVGDKVDMYISDEFFVQPETKYDFTDAPDKLDIIYEDENILLLDKKAGILCHPDGKEYVDTLVARVKKYLYKKGEYNPDESSFTPALVNRIDRNTGGIVIAAKNADSLRVLNEQMKRRNLKKIYLCVLCGIPEKQEGLLNGFLVKDENKNTVRVLKESTDGAKEIKTKYKIISADKEANLSLAEVELLTGRTHQIRAHFASIGCPLLGDGKYGRKKENEKFGFNKQLLYSYKLVFNLDEDSDLLAYLTGQSFEVQDVWFKQKFENGIL